MTINTGVDGSRPDPWRHESQPARLEASPPHLDRGTTITTKPGRPMDPVLTARLLDSTLHLLAEDGLARVNADVVTARSRAGKAAFYRRWPTIGDLIADAVGTCALVPEVPDSGELRADLLALLGAWGRPLDRCERAAAALLGHAGRDTQLDDVLEGAVVRPLAARVGQIADRQDARGQTVTAVRRRLLTMLVQSLWWQRYTSNSPASSGPDVEQLVDVVLLPVVTRP